MAASACDDAGCFSCCGKGEIAEKSNPLKYKRLCTDLFCCLFFIAFIGFLGFILWFAVYTGDYQSLLYDADYLGDRCGVGTNAGKTKAFYPRIPRDMAEQPEIVASGQFWKLELYALCVDECPKEFNVYDPQIIQDYGYDPANSVTQALGTGTKAEWIAATGTIDMLNRCIPRTQSESEEASMCAFPNCTAPEVTSLGGTCQVADPKFGPSWEICAAGTADCKTQKETCMVQATKTEVVTFAMASSDEAGAAMLASVANAVGGVFEIATALQEAMYYILAFGVAMPIACAFVYMILLYLFAKTIIYGMLLVLVLFLLAATAVCFGKSGMNVSGITPESLLEKATGKQNITVPDPAALAFDLSSEDSTWIYTVAFWILLILTIITVVSLALSRKKIQICSAIVKEATLVFRDMPLMMLFPSLSALAQVAVCAWFVFGLCLLQTMKAESIDIALGQTPNATWAAMMGETTIATPSVDPLGPFRSLHENGNLIIALVVVHVYGFYVLIQWVGGMAWCTMSCATGWWYYFNGDEKNHSRFPIARSLGVQLTFHTGSVAFAAFIIAFFDLLRTVCAYIEAQMKPAADKNPMIKVAFKCVSCCLACIKKTVKFISYYGLVFVATNGTNFCYGCFETAKFFINNMGQVSINATCVWLLKLLGLGTIPIGCGIISVYAIEGSGIDNSMYPAVVIFIAAFLMANSCMQVFDCLVTTIFVCSFEDKGRYGSKYMSKHPNLMAVFGVKPGASDDSAAQAPPPEEKTQTL